MAHHMTALKSMESLAVVNKPYKLKGTNLSQLFTSLTTALLFGFGVTASIAPFR